MGTQSTWADMFIFYAKPPALFVSCGRRSPFREQRNEHNLSISHSGSLIALCLFDGTAFVEKSSRAFFSCWQQVHGLSICGDPGQRVHCFWLLFLDLHCCANQK